MGLKEYLRHKMLRLYTKIVKEKATPEYIARGWAIGMFFGCISPIGFQLILSVPVSFLLKGSKIGAVFGTLLTNHFTVFFIYPAQCWFGSLLLGNHIPFASVKEALKNLIEQQNQDALLEIGKDLVAGFFLGGAVMAFVLTPLTYIGVKRLVVEYRKRKELRNSQKTLENKK